jgi:G3E family GTPase
MLRHPALEGKKTAVLVNDFGALPMDAALLPEGDFHVAEINNGSIFCVCVKSGLLSELAMIAEKIAPDILLVEATGLAEPRDFPGILEAANQASAENARKYDPAHPTICVVDALNFPKLSTILPALPAQVKAANLILLNKTDLVSEEEKESVRKRLEELNPSAEIAETRNAEFDFDPEKLRRMAGRDAAAASEELCQTPPSDIARAEFRSDSHPDKTRFYAALEKWRQNILRAKGVVDFGDGPTYVEVVNGVVSSRPWREKSSPEPDKAAAISLVVKNAAPDKIIADLSG